MSIRGTVSQAISLVSSVPTLATRKLDPMLFAVVARPLVRVTVMFTKRTSTAACRLQAESDT